MKKKGFTLIELLVVISIIAMLLAILMPALSKVKKIAARVVCGTNLKGLGNAQTVYAHDYNDQYVVQGGKTNPTLGNSYALWADPTNATNWQNASLSGFTISVGTSLYLLVREADVSPKSFVCPGSSDQVFDGVNNAGPGGQPKDITQLWDFGPKPGGDAAEAAKVSYSYHQPYVAGDTTQGTYTGKKSRFAARGERSSSFAIMADKNPLQDRKLTLAAPVDATGSDYIDKAFFLTGAQTQASGYDWSSVTRNLIYIANAQPHDRDGQNVMYADGHTAYENRPDVSTRNDNIYTPFFQVSPNIESQWRIGAALTGIPTAYAKGSEDTVLVNDGKW